MTPMSLKYLVTVGDSWPAGAELQSPEIHSFPTKIAKSLGVESVNLADPGTSADQALYKLLNTTVDVNWKEALVLFCLTGITRSMHIDIKTREIHPTSENPASVAYYKYIHSDQLDQFNRIRNILAAQQYCQSVGCKILFVNNWDNTPNHRAIDSALFYNKTLTEILNINHNLDDSKLDWHNLSMHLCIKPNQCHPNVAGHALIASELSSWIKEKLNDKPVS